MLGALLAILAAATFGFNNVSVRRGVLSGSVGQALAITVPLGLPLFIIPAFLMGYLGEVGSITRFQWVTLGSAGVLHFVWGRYWNYRAVRAIGSNLAGSFTQIQLVMALSMAMIFLGEVLTIVKIIGIAMTLAGPMIILYTRHGAPKKVEGPKGFRPKMIEGSISAVLAATGYGLSPVLVSAGLSGMGGLGAGVLGGFVSYAVSTAVVVIFLLVRPDQLRLALSTDRTAARWFVVSGVAVWLSQFFRYLALGIAPVTIVQPIQQLSVIFRMLFAWFLNRDYEVFDARAIIGIVVSFLGALLLATSSDIVNGWIQLPDGWNAIMAWHWP
jgi:drug/metabolite transporter (DMT)-like permease